VKKRRFIFTIWPQDPKNKGVICWREEMERDRKEKGTKWALATNKSLNKNEHDVVKKMFETLEWSADDATPQELKALEDVGTIPQSAKEMLDEVSGSYLRTPNVGDHTHRVACFLICLG
jgi:hypothetical protein